MAGLSKYLTVCLVVLLVVTSTIQLTVNAQTIPKPSVPTFTLKYVNNGYDVPTTYKTDPYNGQKIVDQQGYHVNDSDIVVTIKNQPFNEHYNGLNYHLYYNIRYKGHFSEDSDWIVKYVKGNFTFESVDMKYPSNPYVLEQEKSSADTTAWIDLYQVDFTKDAQLDFQVEAVLYFEGKITIAYFLLGGFSSYVVDGYISDQTSGWSNTQTIIIPASSASATPTPSSTNSQSSTTPTVPEFSALAILPLFVVPFVMALILRNKRLYKHL